MPTPAGRPTGSFSPKGSGRVISQIASTASKKPPIVHRLGVPSRAPPQIVQRRSEAWLAMLKRTFLGVVDDRSSALDPAADGISVWADKRSGFYYCADSPYFAKVRPGSLVTQGHALQSGYQPKLGRYCR